MLLVLFMLLSAQKCCAALVTFAAVVAADMMLSCSCHSLRSAAAPDVVAVHPKLLVAVDTVGKD